MKFSVVIPTYKREEDLQKCISSILGQEVFPFEVIIIDDDNLPEKIIEKIKKSFKEKGVNFIYYKKNHQKERRGISESKNIGIKTSSCEIVCVIDDDIVFDKGGFLEIINIWKNEKSDKLIGVGGIGKNYRKKSSLEKTYNNLFKLTSQYSWDVTSVGFQVWDDHIEETQKGYYMHGFISSFRRSSVLTLGGFNPFKGGRTANEDVEFCLRAKNKGYYFKITPDVKVIHNKSKQAREKSFLIGLKEGYTRKIIFKENSPKTLKHYLWFLWSNAGWTLRQFLIGNFKMGIGMVVGVFSK